jgi:hypothetical protein
MAYIKFVIILLDLKICYGWLRIHLSSSASMLKLNIFKNLKFKKVLRLLKIKQKDIFSIKKPDPDPNV